MSATRLAFYGVFIFAGALAVVAIVISTIAPSPPVALAPDPPKNGVTKFSCICAQDFDSVASVLSAYQTADTPAMAGLIARGKAIQLSAGVKVSVLDRENGVATVFIDSGFHSGEHCYLWEKFIE